MRYNDCCSDYAKFCTGEKRLVGPFFFLTDTQQTFVTVCYKPFVGLFLGFFLPFFPAGSTSCKNRCDEKYNAENMCHCNSRCTEYQNCCSDFTELCKTLRPTMCHLVTAHLVSRVPLVFLSFFFFWLIFSDIWWRSHGSE